jgi:Mg2+/Co2+ transporter CorB
MGSDLIILISILVLLIVSGFFSASETAITGASRARIHVLKQHGNPHATTLERLWDKRELMIGTLLIGNNSVNILASTLATSLFIGWFGDNGVIYATAIMTVLVVLFAEVLPKTYALHQPDRTALTVARPIAAVTAFLSPVTKAFDATVQLILRVLGIRLRASEGEHQERAEEELRGAIALHAGQEVPQERAMLRSILDLAQVEVSEIMTHRRDVVTLDAGLPPGEIVQQVLDSPFTRFPVWQDNPDNIVGVLHAKRLLRALHAAEGDQSKVDVLAVAQSPWFIPDTTDLQAQLEAFQARHEHFALVVNEYGDFLGVVTLEDILEEIVGDIADEHDEKMEGVKQEPDGSFVVDGRVTLRDLNRQFDWRLPDDEANTLAGLVLHEARIIPDVGQVFAFHGFRFEILGRQRHQITKLRVIPPAPRSEETAAEGGDPIPPK